MDNDDADRQALYTLLQVMKETMTEMTMSTSTFQDVKKMFTTESLVTLNQRLVNHFIIPIVLRSSERTAELLDEQREASSAEATANTEKILAATTANTEKVLAAFTTLKHAGEEQQAMLLEILKVENSIDGKDDHVLFCPSLRECIRRLKVSPPSQIVFERKDTDKDCIRSVCEWLPLPDPVALTSIEVAQAIAKKLKSDEVEELKGSHLTTDERLANRAEFIAPRQRNIQMKPCDYVDAGKKICGCVEYENDMTANAKCVACEHPYMNHAKFSV